MVKEVPLRVSEKIFKSSPTILGDGIKYHLVHALEEVDMSLDIEVTTWDEERLKDEITLRLNPGWIFRFRPSEDQMAWESSIKSEEMTLWSGDRPTAQLILLDALGWLENRGHQIPGASPWVRRRGDLSSERVHEIAYSKSYGIPDPPHLDPDEIDLVVQASRKSK
jgi:hypothetical protein